MWMTLTANKKNIVLQLEPGSVLPSDDFLADMSASTQEAVKGLEISSGIVTIDDDDYDPAYAKDGKPSPYITLEKAQEIALAQANVNAADAVFDDKEFDHDDGTPIFELEFMANGNEYEYDIQRRSPGKVVKAEHKTAGTQGGTPATGSGSTNYNDTDYGPNNDGVTDYNDTDYGPNNDGVTDYNDTDYGPNNDGVTDYNDTDYGPNNDGVTDYNDTDYGPNNDGVTDYNDTDYGSNNDGVTDYNDTNYDESRQYQLRRYQLRRRRQAITTGKPTMIGTMGIPVMTTKPENELPLRHELKHRINLREDLVLSQRLKKLFAHDKNAGPGGTYRVTSLYFDTPYDSALREKNRRGQPAGKIPAAVLRDGHLFYQAGKEVQNKRPVRQAQRPDDAGTGKGTAFGQLRIPAGFG